MNMEINKRKKAYIYFAIGSFIIGTILLLNVFLQEDKTDDRGCRKNITCKSVILIDHSEAIPTQTKTEIITRASEYIKNTVRENELVSVFTITQLSQNDLHPIFEKCKPPKEGNRLYQDVKTIENRFREDFEKPLLKVLNMSIDGSNETPMAQAIIDISRSTRYFRCKEPSVLIFSDMLENTNNFSLYTFAGNSSQVIKDFTHSRQGMIIRPTLDNASVMIHLISRLNIQKETIKNRDVLWNWFLGDNKGPRASISFDYLPGK